MALTFRLLGLPSAVGSLFSILCVRVDVSTYEDLAHEFYEGRLMIRRGLILRRGYWDKMRIIQMYNKRKG